MEPEGLLPHLQEPATCPYPEPDWSSPLPHPAFILTLSSHLLLGFPSFLLPTSFLTKALYAPLPSHLGESS
jgi:hypothetical protein